MKPDNNDDSKGQMELDENSEQKETEIAEENNIVGADTGQAQEYKDLYQKYMRLAADFENFKKRSAKERADVIAYGNEELIKALLNVLDNLERALEHSESQDDPKPLLEGVKLVHKQFLSCLEKFHVQHIDATQGKEFDPRLHQAIERVESEDVEQGHIISEMLKGYTLKDRLLRPALVIVSKGASVKEEAAEGARNSDEQY